MKIIKYLELYLDVFRDHSQQFGIDRLRGWRCQVHIMQHAMYNTEYRQRHAARTFLQYFHEESKHVETKMSIGIVKIFHYALSPLEAFFAESTPAIQRHDRTKVLQFFPFLCAHLQESNCMQYLSFVNVAKKIERILLAQCFQRF